LLIGDLFVMAIVAAMAGVELPSVRLLLFWMPR
jgi:hypothetical protein